MLMNERHLYFGLVIIWLASASVTSRADTATKPLLRNTAPACTPKIERAWIRSAPPGANTLAGYLMVKNACSSSIKIVGVESRDFGMPMIHRTVIENGVSKMRSPGLLETRYSLLEGLS